ncbi:signal peptidase I (plasmid) [Clostridium perfringens]|uniref:Signal peptidase I n=3 Tax=Clostridium perfringens TaxID=1502 RepID=A0A0N7BST6_CLOPF|nr:MULTISPECIES: signal peptidase I [Clostridium]AKF16646.1 Signal peptidase I [Clostridium perfringens]AMN30639.1 signal peptidase [Clostridium perfringens]MDK7591272.1 signal peptidase I [Clostridium sp. UMB9555B]MDK7629607.1 signal peptidase I [Clostridium sp. UMB9555A]
MFSNKKFKNLFSNWLIPIIAAVLLAVIINKFLLYKIVVPSPSMFPTVEVGNQLFVTKIYNTSNIKRGDVLVFNSDELHELLLKRVIGLPGDNVEIKKDGSVYVNGEKIQEDYVKYPGGKTDMYFNVPEGKFLMLGDNRANSDDARYWTNPYVDNKDIDAKAQIIVYPFNRIGFIR